MRACARAAAQRKDLPQLFDTGLAVVIEPRRLLRHPLRQIRRRRPAQLLQERIGDRHRKPFLAELLADAVDADLVGLVHDDQRHAVKFRRNSRVREHRVQKLPVIDDNLEVLEAQVDEHVGRGREQFGFDGHRRRSDRVDVALVELAEAALLRAIGAPDRLYLIALEELRQLAAILGDHSRERHGEVVAQRQVCLAGFGALAALENLEDQAIAFFTVLALQRLEILDRRRLERLEAVLLIHVGDHADHVLPAPHVFRQEVAHSACWACIYRHS